MWKSPRRSLMNIPSNLCRKVLTLKCLVVDSKEICSCRKVSIQQVAHVVRPNSVMLNGLVASSPTIFRLSLVSVSNFYFSNILLLLLKTRPCRSKEDYWCHANTHVCRGHAEGGHNPTISVCLLPPPYKHWYGLFQDSIW